MDTLPFIAAFVMGLTGSLHCAGMCGPIVLVVPFMSMHGVKKWIGLALYHLSRITVYALLGLLLYSFSSSFDPHWQQYVSIVLGSLLLILGIVSFIPGTALNVRLPWAGMVKRSLGNFVGRPGLLPLTMSGLLNGLLPCGLVYMVLSASLVAENAWSSMLLMYAFGLGTMPMLVSLTLLKTRIGFLRTANVKKWVPVMMFVFGCLFVVRGLNLGIPYLSPKVSIEQNEVKASCCHKD